MAKKNKAVDVSLDETAKAIQEVTGPEPVVNKAESPEDAQKRILAQQEKLLLISLQREERLNREEEEKQKSLKKRNDQRAQSNQSEIRATLEIQANCTHLKGGKGHQETQKADYNVSDHTFVGKEPQGERVIKCLNCRMKWRKEDTMEFLVRGGGKIPNHTRIPWSAPPGQLSAVYMALHSSNRRSSTELVIKPQDTLSEILPGQDTNYKYEI